MIHQKIICFMLFLLLFAGYLPASYPQSGPENALATGKNLYHQAYYDSSLHYFLKAAVQFHSEEIAESYIESLNWLGRTYTELSRFQKADSALDLALNTGIKIFGADRHPVASSYHLMARSAASNGQYDRSNKLERKALHSWQQIYGEEDTLVAESYDIFAFNHRLKGYYDSALFYYNKELKIYINNFGPDHLKASQVYAGLGWVYGAKGELATSLEYNIKALEIQKKELGEKHPIVANTLQTIAWCYNTLGDYSQAIEYYEKTIRIRKETLGPDHPNIGHSYHGIGLAFHYLGDNNKAIQYHILGNSIIEKKQGTQQPILVRYYNFLGDHLMNVGQFERATEYLNKAELLARKLEENNPELVQTYILQAKRFRKLSQPDKQWEYLNKALEVSTTTFGASHHFTSKVRSEIGSYYLQQGDMYRAISSYRKSMQIIRANFGERHPDVAHQSLFLGNALEKEGKYREALEIYHEALISTTEKFSDPDFLKTPDRQDIVSEFAALKALTDKARTLYTIGIQNDQSLTWFHAALESYERAFDLVDYMKNIYTTEEAKVELYENASEVYQNALHVYLKINELTGREKYIENAFSTSEKSKAFILTHAIHDHRARTFGGVQDSLLEKERLLNMELIFLKKRLNSARSRKDAISEKKFLADISSVQITLDNLVREMEKQAPRYYQLKFDNRTASIDVIKNSLLDDKTAMLEYFIGDSVIYVFSLTNQHLKYYVLPKDSAFEDNVKTYRKATGDFSYILHNRKESDTRFLQSAYALYDLLLQKPVSELPEQINRLILVNDGILNQINFESLLTKPWEKDKVNYAELPYLLNKFSISYAHSASILTANRNPHLRKAKKEFMGFAPKYDSNVERKDPLAKDTLLTQANQKRGNYDDLTGAITEVQTIAGIFRGDLWTGDHATESNFKEHASDYSILHLAMHGSLNDLNPIYSSLLFADESDTVNDGKLDLLEIYNLELNADLAVLSACNTGAGKLQHGEGSMSISRAFSYAGCPSVVMSLWKIPDDATSEIMVAFYQNLRNGLEKDEALRQAKISFLSSEQDAIYYHPFFWAGFILSGEAQTIPEKPHYYWWVIIGSGLLLIVSGIFLYRKLVPRQPWNIGLTASAIKAKMEFIISYLRGENLRMKGY